MRASEASEKKICADFLSIRFIQPLCSFSPLILRIFLAEHKIWRTRTICTFVGVPRTRVRRTEYPLKRSEFGVPKRGGYSLIYGCVSHLGYRFCKQTFPSLSHGGSTQNLATTGQAVLETKKMVSSNGWAPEYGYTI